jgi:NAD(P)-dependent dehydrogenase (short-subunit alcohol dehydrogenase family)
MAPRIAIVTGGNRGIGLEVCRQLARQEDIHVLLTARHRERGETAATMLQDEGLPVSFHQLDVTDQHSARRLAKHVADHFGRADMLVNNAAIYVDEGAQVSTVDPALVRRTMETNFYGPLRLSQRFVPLMRRHNYGRIVNVSSRMGALHGMGSSAPAYRLSKTALNALTRLLAAELHGSNILVNSACPGWVQTEMGGAHAPRTVAQGADTIVWLATLADDGPRGGSFRERQPIDW